MPRLEQNGTVQCEAISCPPPQCPAGTAPAYVKGACCKECQREWTTLNPAALLHSHNHRSACIQTTKSTSAAAGFSVSPLLHPRGCLTIDRGPRVVAKLPPRAALKTLPTFCIYMGPINYSKPGFPAQMATGHADQRWWICDRGE